MKRPDKNQNQNQNQRHDLPSLSFRVKRTKCWDNGGVTADIEFNGVTIYGCRVVEGANGDFISFPSRKGNDGKYYSYAYIHLDDTEMAAIIEEIERQINGGE